MISYAVVKNYNNKLQQQFGVTISNFYIKQYFSTLELKLAIIDPLDGPDLSRTILKS